MTRQYFLYDFFGPSRKVSMKVEENGLLEVHDGQVLRIMEGYKDVASYMDGTMTTWTLAVSDGSRPTPFYGFLFPHPEYLPVYFLSDASDVVEALRHLEATLIGTSVDEDLY